MDTQTDTEFTISDKVLRKPPTEARAALIRAIRHALATKVWPDEARARWMDGTAEVVTDSVLAAMPDWVLIPRVATADWTGSTKRAEAAPDSLDAAWAEAEAALPEGWSLSVFRTFSGPTLGYGIEAAWKEPLDGGDFDFLDKLQFVHAETLTAALRALAAKLREVGR